jgi:hypothetical protein
VQLRKLLFLSLVLSFGVVTAFGQRTIKGRIIDDNIEPLPVAGVYDLDTIQLGKTDLNGYFEINVQKGINNLILGGIGYEWAMISIPENCGYVEIVLMQAGFYHYKSHRKIDRLRKRRFEKIPLIHQEAFSKGIFKDEKPCFTRGFVPIKPRLDEIREQTRAKRKQNKKDFDKLSIGDTIRIPFSGSYKYDGTDRTTLFVYSYLFDGDSFDCVIEGVIKDKSKSRKGYNLVYEVTDTGKCKFDFIVYEGKEVAAGQKLEHNMKYFKVLND